MRQTVSKMSGRSFAELLATPGVEEICLLRSGFGIMAFHGGNLEKTTDDIALIAAERAGASVYVVRQPDGIRDHIASSKVTSPALDGFVAHVSECIAVHGYGRQGFWTSLLLGGQNRALAGRLARALESRLPDYEMVEELDDIPPELRGMHPSNPVNRPRLAGVQLELPPRVRGLTPHAAAWPRVEGRVPPTDAVIDALAEVAAAAQVSTGR